MATVEVKVIPILTEIAMGAGTRVMGALEVSGTGMALYYDARATGISVTHVKSGKRLHPLPNFRHLTSALKFLNAIHTNIPRIGQEAAPEISAADGTMLVELYDEARSEK